MWKHMILFLARIMQELQQKKKEERLSKIMHALTPSCGHTLSDKQNVSFCSTS